MATYKLIQDIEAEDKILGPLTLRQFIYALVAVLFLYLSFVVLTKHAAFLLTIFLPPAIFFGFFAFPFGKDQSTEVWALAKIRFLFKPRRRIWDQSGVKELVTITAPKKIERVLTNGLNPAEVEGRLQALANTIDSRGWAIKNVAVNLYGQPNPLVAAPSDRLIDINNMPHEVPSYDVQASDDILDTQSNPIAQQFDQMIQASTQAHRQEIINNMNAQQQAAPADAPADYWFLNQPAAPTAVAPGQATFSKAQVVLPGSADDTAVPAKAETPAEEVLAEKLKAQHLAQPESYSHLRTLQPLGNQAAPAPAPAPQASLTSRPAPDPAILSLASNNDLNVATLARQANKSKNLPPDDEVVISLH